MKPQHKDTFETFWDRMRLIHGPDIQEHVQADLKLLHGGETQPQAQVEAKDTERP